MMYLGIRLLKKYFGKNEKNYVNNGKKQVLERNLERWDDTENR